MVISVKKQALPTSEPLREYLRKENISFEWLFQDDGDTNESPDGDLADNYVQAFRDKNGAGDRADIDGASDNDDRGGLREKESDHNANMNARRLESKSSGKPAPGQLFMQMREMRDGSLRFSLWALLLAKYMLSTLLHDDE